VPTFTGTEKQNIENKVFKVLDAREHHSEMTLGELYNPETMPNNLQIAHRELDEVVDGIYRNKPFENEEERLAHLFNLYEQMEEETVLV
jgi:hypothetical protein